MPRSLRLLLVEDHPDSAELMAELLELHGHTVQIANTASAAMQLASMQVFDLVVSDVGLPDQDGYALMHELRTRYALKGIAMTGSQRREELGADQDTGFIAHLVKPVSLQILVQTIERVSSDP